MIFSLLRIWIVVSIFIFRSIKNKNRLFYFIRRILTIFNNLSFENKGNSGCRMPDAGYLLPFLHLSNTTAVMPVDPLKVIILHY